MGSSALLRLLAAVGFAVLVVGSGCGGGSETPECEDNVDNDLDGLTDDADPACMAGNDRENQDPTVACNNGLDDDNDGLTDFPDDPGCESDSDTDEFGSGLPDCDDDRDNDGDGKIDFPNDPGCLVPNQDSETDDCPSGPNCPECGDGQDNDFDGMIDFGGGDTNCTSAADNTELDISPNACGNGTSVLPLPANGMVSGTLGTGISNLMPVRCTGAVGTGTEAVYVITVAQRETLVASTDDPATTADTVLYLRRACTNTTTELVCNNDIGPTNTDSSFTVTVDPGTYFLVVDARGPATSGGYVLRVTRHAALGAACTMESECAPDHICRVPAGGTGMSCELPVCGDGRDDDGDTDIDFPNDPGCTSALDADESDTCPGAGCPACGNGVDDDNDGQTDFPADTSCASASAVSEFNCVGADPVRLFTGNVTAQSTASLTNDLTLTCGTNGRDEVWLLRVSAALAEIRVDTIGSTIDTALSLRRSSCTGFDLQCDDDSAGSGDSSLYLIDLQVGDYYIVVDDKNTSGQYNLNVSGVWANGSACDPASTAFACGPGYQCTGTVPGATCTPVACNDTVDEDGDGLPGFPSDPGCVDSSDDDESDACFPTVGVGCPACANDVDDDTDTFIDYPNDPGCGFAAQASELAPCTSFDPVIPFTGNLAGVGGIGSRFNDAAPSCGANGRDEIYRLIVPRPLTNLRIDTLGSVLDTVVNVRVGTCNGADLACDDNTALNGDSLINLTNVSVGEYFIIVEDRFVASPGTYNLNVRGTLQVGASCSPASTLFVCPSAHACIGAPGLETCQPAACNDTIDQDGDGFPGFPTDPGCVDVSDPDESDDCPLGPMCPQCSNDVSDDGDPWIDYPVDPGCVSANDGSEIQCASTDAVINVTGQVAGAVTTGRANDLTLSCGTNARDEVYRLVLDRLVTQLRVDTIGSALDTVVAIRRSDCGAADLVCNDNGPGAGTASIATIANPAIGEYYIVVDDKTSANSTYNLNIKAMLPVSASCDPASTIFVCPDAYICAGAAGSETCVPGPCNDTVDADGDGFPGFPTDPGCTSVSDPDEADTCFPTPMAGCPICSDDVDNDLDGFTDYPMDPTCASAADNVEAAVCTSADPILTFSANVVNATMNTRLNDLALSCGTNGRDEIYRFIVDRPLARLRVDTIGSALDTVVAVRRTNCTGTDLACDDNAAGNGDSRVLLNNVSQGEYFIIVDDKNLTGAYNLNVQGELPGGAACTPGAPFYICTTGYTCGGTTGAETCRPTVCNDLVDADGDGANGYPDDPGCVDISDNDEADTCFPTPMAGCPACANDVDDDGDGFIDYPLDTGCLSAASPSEFTCIGEADPATIITAGVSSGTNVGAANNFTPTCQGLNGAEVPFALTLPVPVQTLTIDTEGSTPLTDTILMFMDQSCGMQLQCDDDSGTGFLSLITRANVAAGTYFILVDGYNGQQGGFTLNVTGTVAAGQACTSPLFASGLLRCAGTCTAGVCN